MRWENKAMAGRPANFRSSIEGQKGPRNSYADDVGKSPEKRGEG